MGLEEIVADHACEVEAKSVFPRERPIVIDRRLLAYFSQLLKLRRGRVTIKGGVT